MKFRIYIETYGCALNRGDTSIIKTILSRNGYDIVETIDEADVVIINTCIVRQDTEARMMKRLRELSKLNKKIIVAGCMAKVMPYTIKKLCPKAVIVSPQNIHRIIEAIHSLPGSMFVIGEKPRDIVPKIVDGVKVTIPVAEGCLDECAFCIVRVARPHLRSIPIDCVVKTVKELLDNGAKEIEITAQDLGVYGIDIYGDYALPKLLQELLSIDREFKLRIGQMNPYYLRYFLDEIIEILKDPRVFKYLHIPIQSGDNKVLEIMKRRGSVEEFLELIAELRKKIPLIQIATDIIVGHPGEDHSSFLNSVKLILENHIDRVHIARYSIRPYTEAARMKQVPDPLKKTWCSYIEKIYEVVALHNNLEFIGSKTKIFIDEYSRETGTYIGRTIDYRPVVILNKSKDISLGIEVYVDIVDATYYDLRGLVIE